ncbi:hypothetical protein PR202_ga24648 [Eleusine coracana subsp. coracana]|uniref:DUF8039 domain-containing protein n=1 Tax=Eleusine coracana subsp. coracana TaxID=191504 RepID=A0AAV5D9N2_ELECO|nr:hypothetical protein PR202_ga24648 [Eleusine coracana subsp. coracana]
MPPGRLLASLSTRPDATSPTDAPDAAFDSPADVPDATSASPADAPKAKDMEPKALDAEVDEGDGSPSNYLNLNQEDEKNLESEEDDDVEGPNQGNDDVEGENQDNDDTQTSFQVRLVTLVLSHARMVAYGLAKPLVKGTLFRDHPIPKGYAMVHLVSVKHDHRKRKLDHLGDKGEFKLEKIIGRYVLWHKRDIEFGNSD